MGKAKYKLLENQTKLLTNVLKMAAYHIETRLRDLLVPHYKNAAKDGRKLVVAALKTKGSLQLEQGKIIITLQPQSSPARTRAINGLLASLNERQANFPGSDRIIVFRPTPVSEIARPR